MLALLHHNIYEFNIVHIYDIVKSEIVATTTLLNFKPDLAEYKVLIVFENLLVMTVVYVFYESRVQGN